jgi:hypothetical protein
MGHKIINTGDYLLIVDDSEIKEGDWVVDFRLDGRILVSKWNEEDYEDGFFFDAKKVISHLPLNNSPILEGVDLLPPLEDEVDKFESFLDREIELELNTKETIDRIKWYYQQYFKSKQKNYTEEDLMKAIDMAREYTPDVVGFTKDEIIQSLNQPKMPVKFVCEMKKDYRKNDDGEPIGLPVHETNKPKTTTNLQGLTQWVGEYIY